MVLCLHQSNVYIKYKLRVWIVQKFVPLVGAKTALVRGRQTTPSHVSQYATKYGTLRKSCSILRHCIVFAPKQCLYQKETIGMESPKFHSSSRCKTRTYLRGTVNCPVSCKLVLDRERNIAEIRVYLWP